MIKNIENFILNPSFVIPILYSSILLNIILLLILARIMGPLRKALMVLYDIHYPLSTDKRKKNQSLTTENKDSKPNRDKQQINTQELFFQ